MTGRWWGGWLVVCLVTLVNSKVDLDSPLRLAHCRATCLYDVQMDTRHWTDEVCRHNSDCSQCWRGCSELLGGDDAFNKDRCTSSQCRGGCRRACEFYWSSAAAPHSQPVLLTHHEEVVTVAGPRVSWPALLPAVYVVMARPADQPWTVLGQTLEPAWALSPALQVTGDGVRVLVVGRAGLVRVLSPRPPPHSRLGEVMTVIRSLGLDHHHYLANTTLSGSLGGNHTSNTSQVAWRLRQVSLLRQSGLVLAQVSWRPLVRGEIAQDYLVTWRLDGGVLSGNLVTNTSCVTLSLWPHALYTIQVSLLGSGPPELQSEPLVLDTRQGPPPPLPAGHRHTPGPPPGVVGAVGVAAAVLVFLAVTLTATWRWQHRLSLPHSKLLDEESGTPTLYRVFPPAARPFVDRPDFRQDLFSSTDNLLQAN